MESARVRNRRESLARVVPAALAVFALAFLIGLPRAEAGTYTVNECRSGIGTAYQDAPDAFFWTNSVYLDGNHCPNWAGGLGKHVTHPGYTFSVAANGSQTFTAPDGTLFNSLSAKGRLSTASGHSVIISMIYPNGTSNSYSVGIGGIQDGQGFDVVAVPGSNLKSLVAAIACGGYCPWSGSYGYAALGELQFQVNDFTAPTIDALGGSLVAGGTRRGTESLTIGAGDRGGGVRRAIVRVNGTHVASPENNTCYIPGGFLDRFRPCSASAGMQLSIDTEQGPWRLGANTLEVCAYDVAGPGSTPNAGCAVRQVEVDNRCEASGGTPATQVDVALEHEGELASSVTVDSDEGVPLKGTVRSGGSAVGGANVCVYEEIDAPGEDRELIAIAKTKSNGEFGVQLTPGPSRNVEVMYRFNNAVLHGPILRIDSKARPRLKVRPKSLKNGESARFRGSIPGPYNAGKAVALQARAGKKWRTFKLLRTDDRGRFKGRYRFHHTRGRVVYKFRVLVKRQAGYPYLPGPSKKRRARVKG